MTDNKQYPELPVIEHWLNNTYTASQMRQYVDEDRAMRSSRIDELEQLLAEAYQVVGVLLSDTDQFDTDHGTKILDNLSQMKPVHDDVLPWESRAMRAAPQGELTEREAEEGGE